MKFRTEVVPDSHKGLLTHHHRVMTIGSCFSDNLGAFLSNSLFDVLVNPYGTIYNPASIAYCLERILHNRPYSEEELFEANGKWNSWYHHSDFSNIDKAKTRQRIDDMYDMSADYLKHGSCLMITFGTAWVYLLNDTDTVVANCHKVPARRFSREMLSVNDIVNRWTSLIQQIQSLNPEMRFIFTVSPIRHTADGAHGNQISKSTLLLALNEIVNTCSECYYFPAYEIMMDDLRDYRYYATDMKHPSESAIAYIREKFIDAYFTDETAELASKCEAVTTRMQHRIDSDDQSPATLNFINGTRRAAIDILTKYSYLATAMTRCAKRYNYEL